MRTMLAMVTTGALLVSSALGNIYKDYKSAEEAAAKSGKLIFVLYFTKDTRYDLNKTQERMVTSPASQAVLRNYEVAIVHMDKGGTQVQRFASAMGLRQYLPPVWVIASPEGEYLGGGDGMRTTRENGDTYYKPGGVRIFPPPGKTGKPMETSIDRWRQFMAAAARRYPTITAADRAKAEKLKARAAEDMEKGHIYKAAFAMKSLARIWWPKKFVSECKTLEDKIKTKAQEIVDKAEELAGQDKPLEAALAYARIQRHFTSRMPQGVKAAQKLGILLRTHKDIKEQYTRAVQDEEAAELLAEARALAKDGETLKAKQAYALLTRKYGQTPSAILAKDEMTALGVAPATPPAAGGGEATVVVDVTTGNEKPPAGATTPAPAGDDEAEKAAEKLLRLGKSYRANGLKKPAAAKLRACIKDYPNTKAAADAKALLKVWELAGGS